MPGCSSSPASSAAAESDCIIPRGGSGYGHNWVTYRCTSCNFVILTQSTLGNKSTRNLLALYPEVEAVAQELPGKARSYLEQAISAYMHPTALQCLQAPRSMDLFPKRHRNHLALLVAVVLVTSHLLPLFG